MAGGMKDLEASVAEIDDVAALITGAQTASLPSRRDAAGWDAAADAFAAFLDA